MSTDLHPFEITQHRPLPIEMQPTDEPGRYRLRYEATARCSCGSAVTEVGEQALLRAFGLMAAHCERAKRVESILFEMMTDDRDAIGPRTAAHVAQLAEAELIGEVRGWRVEWAQNGSVARPNSIVQGRLMQRYKMLRMTEIRKSSDDLPVTERRILAAELVLDELKAEFVATGQ